MAIQLSNTGITFSDSTSQNTISISGGTNINVGNGTFFSDKANNKIRFKRLAVANVGFNTVTMIDDGKTVKITYADTQATQAVCSTMVIGG